MGLDDRAGSRRDRVLDPADAQRHDDRRPRHCGSVGQVVRPGRGLPGHGHRSAAATSEEEYITSGLLRSSNQVDLTDSTRLFTDPSYLAKDARTLSRRSYTLVKIPVDPIAHTFRPGTELRIVISAPGGDRPSWEFDTLDHDQSATVGIGGIAASTLVVNAVAGVKSTPILPPCGSLPASRAASSEPRVISARRPSADPLGGKGNADP